MDSGPRSGKNAPKKGKVRKATNPGGRERQRTVRAKPRKSTGKEGQGRQHAGRASTAAGRGRSGLGGAGVR